MTTKKYPGCQCPMTIENCDKYGVTDNQVKDFCRDGCSVICEQEFQKRFVRTKEVTGNGN